MGEVKRFINKTNAQDDVDEAARDRRLPEAQLLYNGETSGKQITSYSSPAKFDATGLVGTSYLARPTSVDASRGACSLRQRDLSEYR